MKFSNFVYACCPQTLASVVVRARVRMLMKSLSLSLSSSLFMLLLLSLLLLSRIKCTNAPNLWRNSIFCHFRLYFECDDWIYGNERGSLLKCAEFAIESRQQSIIIRSNFLLLFLCHLLQFSLVWLLFPRSFVESILAIRRKQKAHVNKAHISLKLFRYQHKYQHHRRKWQCVQSYHHHHLLEYAMHSNHKI